MSYHFVACPIVKHKPQRLRHLLVCSLCLLLLACTSRHTPAPVKELYQGKTFFDYPSREFTGDTYTVRKGDTLFAIAWYSGNDYRDIAQINNIKKPYRIFPGQVIQIRKPTSTIRPKSQEITGTTSKPKANQPVDLPKNQAYGKREQNVNEKFSNSKVGKFPNQVKQWSWPTNKPVTRGFSSKEGGNNGLDFSGTKGSPILAAASGKVVYTGSALRGFGNLVIIKHSEAYLSAYAHNDKVLVKEQQWVKIGQRIATMGNSGTDKVKLHFEVRYRGKTVNPLNYLPKR